MFCKQVRTICLNLFVLAILNLCYGYKVEMEIRDGGKNKTITQFEIGDHDNPPFKTEAVEQLYKDEMISNFKGTSAHHDTETEITVRSTPALVKGKPDKTIKQYGVKVSGFLGNVRQKRSLDQLSQECVQPDGDSTTSNKAVTVETGETIHLPCHGCHESERQMYESMEWMRLDQYPNSEGLYHLKEVRPHIHDDEKLNRISVTLDHTLVIKRAKLSDAGSYFCKPSDKTGTFMNLRLQWKELQEYIAEQSHMKYYFHVDIIDLNNLDTIDVSSYSNIKQMKQEIVPDLNIVITTKWHPWTSCSVCDDAGIRKRMGICFVRKHDSSKPIPHTYLKNILDFANDGIPCQSQFLRDFRQDLFLRKPNQIQIEECNVPCKVSLSERTKRGLDLFSKPQLKDVNIRKSTKGKKSKSKPQKKTVRLGSYFILKCPGVSITKTINWVNGSTLVHLMKIQKFSKKRITIDMFGNLHFKAAEQTDSGTYSCWLKKKMKQKYEVTIQQDHSATRMKYTIYLCISFICDLLAFVALAVVRYLQRKVQRRKRVKIKETSDSDADDEDDDETSSSSDASSDDSD